jgi:hypothetical protein
MRGTSFNPESSLLDMFSSQQPSSSSTIYGPSTTSSFASLPQLDYSRANYTNESMTMHQSFSAPSLPSAFTSPSYNQLASYQPSALFQPSQMTQGQGQFPSHYQASYYSGYQSDLDLSSPSPDSEHGNIDGNNFMAQW